MGYNKLSITLDYYIESLKGCSREEYFYLYKLYRLKRKARKEYIYNSDCYKYEAQLNGVNRIEEFRNKAQFNKIFKDFIHRKWLYTLEANYEDFSSFIHGEGGTQYICKPVNSSMGRGVFKLTSNTSEDDKALFERLKKNHYLIEECVEGIHELSRLHSNSLNTIRITTLIENGKVTYLWSFIRIGRTIR